MDLFYFKEPENSQTRFPAHVCLIWAHLCKTLVLLEAGFAINISTRSVILFKYQKITPGSAYSTLLTQRKLTSIWSPRLPAHTPDVLISVTSPEPLPHIRRRATPSLDLVFVFVYCLPMHTWPLHATPTGIRS
jgi:hypothetical protein